MSRSMARALVFFCLAATCRVSAEEPELNRYLNIRSAGAPGLSPDGRQLTFLSNVTGTSQLWTVPRDGGWPDQLTFYEEKVTFDRWSPTGQWILYGLDVGGAEKFQLFLISPDGARTVAIDANPEVRHESGIWSPDGNHVAFASNARDPQFFDVYIYDLISGKSELVYKDDHYNLPTDWSPDGRSLLVTRDNTNFDQDLFVIDVSSRKVVQLNDDQEEVRYQNARFGSDNQTVYVVSDRGRDMLGPARIDVATQKVTFLSAAKWETEQLQLSDDARYMVTVLNVDGASELEVRDLRTNRMLQLPPLPRGQVSGPAFSHDGRFLAFGLNGPKYNGDAWVLDLERRTVKQVTRSGRSGLPQAGFVEPEVVRYATFDGKQIPALMYLPAGAVKDGKRAAIVKMHGGPEGQAGQRFDPTTQYFLAKGYVVMEPNVRGSTGYGKAYSHLDDIRLREDSIKDMGAAAEYLKASGYVDAKKLAVLGGSYGGYMVLSALTFQPEIWAAGIDIVGIANFKTFLNNTSSYRRSQRTAEYGDPEKDGDFLDKVSPLHYVDKIKAPLMVIQGANDPRVPQSEADQIVEAVKKKGGVVEYLLFADEGHGLGKLSNRLKATAAEAAFLDRYVGK